MPSPAQTGGGLSRPAGDPDQAARHIRATVAEIWTRVAEWRDSPRWTGNDEDQQQYDQTASAVNTINELPDDTGPHALAATVEPILTAWWPIWTGPKQSIYAEVDRLRDIAYPWREPEPPAA